MRFQSPVVHREMCFNLLIVSSVVVLRSLGNGLPRSPHHPFNQLEETLRVCVCVQTLQLYALVHLSALIPHNLIQWYCSLIFFLECRSTHTLFWVCTLAATQVHTWGMHRLLNLIHGHDFWLPQAMKYNWPLKWANVRRLPCSLWTSIWLHTVVNNRLYCNCVSIYRFKDPLNLIH